MDFSHRQSPVAQAQSSVHAHPAPHPTAAGAMPPSNNSSKPNKTSELVESKWWRIVTTILLFSLTIVVVSLGVLFYVSSSKESKYVDTDQYQAVFLTNNQVYFGHIKTITDSYIDLQNIFYLNNQSSQGTSTSSSSTSSLSLVKLGCEVHGPTDEMIIERPQVTFWENLRSNGQVATAIGTWVKDNPNGQTCSTTNSTASTTQSTAPDTSSTAATSTTK